MNDRVHIGLRLDATADVPLTLSQADRRQHAYVIGKTGVGKSTMLENLAIQDIRAARGCGFIDPHGASATKLLDLIPPGRVKDVVYFDPSDYDHPIGLNPFFNVPPSRRHAIVSGFVGAIKAIWPEFFGPRMEDCLNSAVAAILECQNVSPLGLLRMLSDVDYRAWVLRQVKDPWLLHYWERFDFKDARTQAEIVAPIENKLNQFLLPNHMRNILSQIRNRLDFRAMMDRGKIFIADLSKGKIGETNTNLLGSLLVTQFDLAAKSRADVPEKQRRDFNLIVDEFPSFVSESFASILSESRKYRLCLTIANQYLEQISPKILNAVIGNVGSLISFRVGHTDAEQLEKAFGRSVSASTLSGLDNYEICAKLVRDGRDMEPCLARTYPPLGTSYGRTDAIKNYSRERYGTSRELIEGRIAKWLDSPPD